MGNIETVKGILFDTADAIREKTGRSALIDFPDFPDEVRSIEVGGNAPNPDDPLLLIDWDGTLLYSYTYEESQLISEFPDTPTHEGLTFQSWNWSEVIAKTWLQNHRGAQLKVGATYTPTDGQDHNYWRSPRLSASNQIYMQHRATPSIGNYAFRRRYSLTSVSLPDGLTGIGADAFEECTSLTTIIFPNSLTGIGANAFYGCTSLTSVSLPDGLAGIGDSAFQYCASLAAISLPNSLTTISRSEFEDCYALIAISLPSGLTGIGGYAFANCPSLYKLDIPASVTLINDYAFYNCSSLVDVVLRGKPSLGGSTVFDGNPSNQRFYVHRSDLSWFSTATNWSAIYGEGKIVAAADYIEYLQSIGIDTSDFEGE